MSETSHCIEGVERHGSPEPVSVAHGLWKVGIASSKAVVAWADTMIVRCDAVPMELVELSLLPLRARVELRLWLNSRSAPMLTRKIRWHGDACPRTWIDRYETTVRSCCRQVAQPPGPR